MHAWLQWMRMALIPAGFALLTACGPVPSASAPGSSQLYINTDPTDASIYCDGRAMPNLTPTTLKGLAAGDHLVVAHKAGFAETRTTVTIQSGERIALDLKLEPIFGLVLIHSTPPGADVEIDSSHYGKTPLLIPNFPLGQHQVKLSAQNFTPKVVDVTVEDRTPKQVNINLQSDSARVVFESKPAGAQVTINGAAIGNTPCKAERLSSGKHRLEIALKGYTPYRDELTAQPGEERTLTVELKPLPGKLSVVSIPSKARLYLNDQYKAETPFVTNNILSGQCVLRVELPGYASQTRTVTVTAGEEPVVEFQLIKDSGALLLSTEPPGVTVFMDGEKRGITSALGQDPISTQLTLDLVPKGQHKLQLTKPGYHDSTSTVDMAPNQTLILHKKLTVRPVAFVPTIIVRTGADAEHTFRGIIRETYNNGDIKVEIEPGIFKTFMQSEIQSTETIKAP